MTMHDALSPYFETSKWSIVPTQFLNPPVSLKPDFRDSFPRLLPSVDPPS